MFLLLQRKIITLHVNKTNFKTEKMKIVNSLSAAAAALLLFVSCSKDPENHALYVLHPSSPRYQIFADQESDSIVFQTFDSYNMLSLNDWITITAGDSYDVKYDYRNLYEFTSLVSFKPNTTGKTRVGTVRVQSYDYQSAAVFTQLGYMDIYHPAPQLTTTADSVSFDMNVAATVAVDSICFNVTKNWTLDYAADADRTWLTIDKKEGAAGHGMVTISIAPNADTENERTTVLELKCGEVTNKINVKQSKADAVPTE